MSTDGEDGSPRVQEGEWVLGVEVLGLVDLLAGEVLEEVLGRGRSSAWSTCSPARSSRRSSAAEVLAGLVDLLAGEASSRRSSAAEDPRPGRPARRRGPRGGPRPRRSSAWSTCSPARSSRRSSAAEVLGLVDLLAGEVLEEVLGL